MLQFFKNKKWAKQWFRKTAALCFALLLLSSSLIVAVSPMQASAANTDSPKYGLSQDALDIVNKPPEKAPEIGWVEAGILSASGGVVSSLAHLLLTVTGWGLWAAGLLLQKIMDLSVNNMQAIVNSDGVNAAWATFRDVANMFFIFILLYIAISTILGTGDINMKKMLSRIVIVAILLNFSFFLTKVAVDASNILTIGFYNQIIKTTCGTDGGVAGNLGAVFMCKMGLTSIWDGSVIDNLGFAVGTWGEVGKIAVLGVMGSIFFLVATFVFLAAAIMFIARYVVLIFLFILSPLAFAAMAVPNNDKYFGKWRDSLIDNCIFAPAFMLMIWVTLKVLNAVAISPSDGSLANALTGISGGKPSAAAGGAILNFVIVIALIIGALIVAKQFGAYGAGGAVKMLKKARGSVTGAIGRNTIGWGAHALDKKMGDSDGRFGRFANTTLGRTIRESTTGALAKQGFGSKLGYKKKLDEKEKADKKYADTVYEKRKGAAEFELNQATRKRNELELNLSSKKKEYDESQLPQKQELEANIAKDKKQYGELDAAQKSDSDLLSRTTSPVGYQAIKDRMDARAKQMTSLNDQIEKGPAAVELKKLAESRKKFGEDLQEQIKVAQEAVTKLHSVPDEGEAESLFTTTGKEAEVRAKGRSLGFSKEKLEDFMRLEKEKFISGLKREKVDGKGNPIAKIALKREAANFKTFFWRTSSLNKAMMKALREDKKQGKKPADEMLEAAKKALKEDGGGDEEKGEKEEKTEEKGGK